MAEIQWIITGLSFFQIRDLTIVASEVKILFLQWTVTTLIQHNLILNSLNLA